MFDSGISAGSLISELKDEIDVAIPIKNKSYADSLNSLEQLLYTEIIKKQRSTSLSLHNPFFIGSFDLSDIAVGTGEKQVVFEDVYALYDIDGVQLKKSTPASFAFFKNTWCKYGESSIGVNSMTGSVRVIYFVRPALKTVNADDEVGAGNVMLPTEFIDLAKAKLRADAYKIANEDALAAKWMNDYNILLETFKEWIERKKPHFGM